MSSHCADIYRGYRAPAMDAATSGQCWPLDTHVSQGGVLSILAALKGGGLAMAIEVELVFAFTGKRGAQEFRDWLFHKDYINKTLVLNTVRVIVSGYRDRF